MRFQLPDTLFGSALAYICHLGQWVQVTGCRREYLKSEALAVGPGQMGPLVGFSCDLGPILPVEPGA